MRTEVKVGLVVLLIIAIPTSLWWLGRGSQVTGDLPFESVPQSEASTPPEMARLAGDRAVAPARPAPEPVEPARVPTASLPPVQASNQPEPAKPPPQAKHEEPAAVAPAPTTRPARSPAVAPTAEPAPQRKPVAAEPAARPGLEAGASRGSESAGPAVPGQSYTIQPGDVLIDIARMYYGDGSLWRAIKLANPGLDENRLRIGQQIIVPPREQAERLLAAARPAPVRANSAAAATVRDDLVYVVAAGDTLISIARNVLGDASRWEEIYALNRDRLESPDLIVPGMKLRLPERKRGSAATTRP